MQKKYQLPKFCRYAIYIIVCLSNLGRADFEENLEVTPKANPKIPDAAPTKGNPTPVSQQNPNKDDKTLPNQVTTPSAVANPLPPAAVPKPATNPKGNPSPKASSKSSSTLGDAGKKREGILSPDLREHDTQAPIQLINGDSLEGSMKQGIVIIKGNVAIKQDDTDIFADTCELITTPGNNQPDRMIARGHVRLQKTPKNAINGLRAKADEIDYDVKTGKVLLKGSPKVWRGDEVVQGEIIEIDLTTQGISVKKASALIAPPEKK